MTRISFLFFQTRYSKYFFAFFLFFLFTSVVFGQEKMPVPLDTTIHWAPTGIRLGGDLISPVKSYFGNKFNGWEVNAETDFWRYQLAVDYGYWSRHISMTDTITSQYSNSGHYWRAGIDVNFLLKDIDRNMFFLGFRYGQSFFSEGLTYNYKVNYYSPTLVSLNNDLIVRWLELTGGLRIRVWRGFWMGYTARLKFMPRITGDQQFETYDMPGFGLRVNNRLYWGFNYQLFWRFSWKKTGALRVKN